MRKHTTPPTKPLPLETIEKIADPAAQARAAAAVMAYAEYRRSQGMTIRDAAIRQLRAATKLTIPEIAEQIGVSTGTVKAVLR